MCPYVIFSSILLLPCTQLLFVSPKHPVPGPGWLPETAREDPSPIPACGELKVWQQTQDMKANDATAMTGATQEVVKRTQALESQCLGSPSSQPLTILAV